MRPLGGKPGYIFSLFFVPRGPPKSLIDPPFTLRPVRTNAPPENDFFLQIALIISTMQFE